MLYWELILDKNDPIMRDQAGDHPYVDGRFVIESRDLNFDAAAKRFSKAVQAIGFDPRHDTVVIRLRLEGYGGNHDFDILQSWATWVDFIRPDYRPLTRPMLEALGISVSKEAC